MNRFFPVEQFGEVTTVTPIAVGLSGAAVHDVATTTGDYILRVDGAARDGWANGVRAQRLAAAHGVAPPFLLVDEDAAATVSRKIAGTPFGAAVGEPAQRQAIFTSLVAQLRTLHALPATGFDENDVRALASETWASQSARPGFPAWAAPLGARLPALTFDDRRVLSHGDLNPANLIWDGAKVWLLDWDGAGRAHPYLDLAVITTFVNLRDEDALGLLAAQERAPVDAEVFRALRTLARIVYGCVFLRLVPDLAQITFLDRDETPTLTQCYTLMASGQLSMATPSGQALVGAALLRQAF